MQQIVAALPTTFICGQFTVSLGGPYPAPPRLCPTSSAGSITAVQTRKTESPIHQRDGGDNRLVNADATATDRIIREDEYQRCFDTCIGTRPGQQDDAAVQHCGGSDMQNRDTSGEAGQHACGTNCNCSEQNTTNAYNSWHKRAATEDERAVKRNQKRMD